MAEPVGALHVAITASTVDYLRKLDEAGEAARRFSAGASSQMQQVANSTRASMGAFSASFGDFGAHATSAEKAARAASNFAVVLGEQVPAGATKALAGLRTLAVTGFSPLGLAIGAATVAAGLLAGHLSSRTNPEVERTKELLAEGAREAERFHVALRMAQTGEAQGIASRRAEIQRLREEVLSAEIAIGEKRDAYAREVAEGRGTFESRGPKSFMQMRLSREIDELALAADKKRRILDELVPLDEAATRREESLSDATRERVEREAQERDKIIEFQRELAHEREAAYGEMIRGIEGESADPFSPGERDKFEALRDSAAEAAEAMRLLEERVGHTGLLQDAARDAEEAAALIEENVTPHFGADLEKWEAWNRRRADLLREMPEEARKANLDILTVTMSASERAIAVHVSETEAKIAELRRYNLYAEAAEFERLAKIEESALRRADAEEKAAKAADLARKTVTLEEKAYDRLATGLSSGVVDSLYAIADGTQTAAEAFREMTISIIRDITAMIAKTLILKAISTLGGPFAGLAGAAGGQLGDVGSAALKSAPLASSALRSAPGSASGPAVVVNNFAPGVVAQSVTGSDGSIEIAVRSVIADDLERGGPVAQTLKRGFGVSRRGRSG